MSLNDQQLDLAIALSLQESYNNEAKNAGNNIHKSSLESGDTINDDESLALALSLVDSDPNADEGTDVKKQPSKISDTSNDQIDFWNSIFNWSTLINNTKASNFAPLYVCFECNKPWTNGFKMSNNKRYHTYCFKCSGCNRLIDESFVTRHDQPYHLHCSQELFHPKCTLCQNTLNGRYYHHPYFINDKYCSSHDLTADWRNCCSCRRYEPIATKTSSSSFLSTATLNKRFQDLSDWRCICSECVQTIVLDSTEAATLYREVVDFMEHELNMIIPATMRQVPVLAVDIPTLNEQQQYDNTGNHHQHNNDHSNNVKSGLTNNRYQQCLTRGLTLHSVSTTTTTRIVQHMTKGGIKSIWEQSNKLFGFSNPSGNNCNNDNNHHEIRQYNSTNEVREVTAVLVLYGLPRALTASILAHEAMHVWMKLATELTNADINVTTTTATLGDNRKESKKNTNHNNKDRYGNSNTSSSMRMPLDLPSPVEEGLCQLIAYQYLTWLLSSSSDVNNHNNNSIMKTANREDDMSPSLMGYYRQAISQDTDKIYGDGFRQAYACFNTLGGESSSLHMLLEHVGIYRDFPSI